LEGGGGRVKSAFGLKGRNPESRKSQARKKGEDGRMKLANKKGHPREGYFRRMRLRT